MSKVLVGLTGSIACFKVAALISDLVKDGHEVRCIVTPSALKFIGKSTLEGLTGQRVSMDLFADGENMDHIHLGRWADIFLIAPCTAHTLAKLKNGLADDLLTTTALAFEKTKKLYIAPAMNKEMWSHSTTQDSIKALQDRGCILIEPESGSLACGEVGDGRLADPIKIKSRLFQRKKGRILITGGGTREPIDGVRYIGNSSTGRTSKILSEELERQGFEVSLLMAQESFTDFESLQGLLKTKLSEEKFDAVVHAAAVSDYSVSNIKTSDYEGPADRNLKLGTNESLSVELKQNPKILNSLRDWSQNSNIMVVGFKLTNTKDEKERVQAVEKLFCESPADLVIHNDLTEIKEGRHPFRVLKKDCVLAEAEGARALAEKLSEYLGGAR